MAWTTRAITLACALLVAACAGAPDATECATGITCPEGTKCAAVQPICITNDCGDGIVQSTEICDDGNIEDGDGCAANCLSREQCGDGVLNSAAGELCDDGNTDGGDGCSSDCRSVEVCGNGIPDVNEACDDGNTVSGDGCAGDCKSTEICGNGIVDINEKCDDGGDPGGCNDDCQGGTGCGDGAIDIDGSGNPLEECDDGNTNDHDDCRDDCKLNVCGDGNIQSSGARVEDCDPSIGFGETIDCNIDCTASSCGDGKINNAAGEQCDKGLGLNADDRDCTSACQVNVCGDGLKNALGPDHIEDCDDANTNQTDGCTTLCTTAAECGNGVLEMGEACDDSNTSSGDGCSAACQFESCGDGVENNGEECDPGAAGETAGCNADCTDYECGDLKINRAAGEECDEGTSNADTAACKSNCKLNVCGDGHVGPGEQCDDANADNNDGCTTSCTTPFCGNGIVDGATMTTPAEECDDGNANDDDGCLTTCKYNKCGDGHVNTGVEQCDNGTANNGWTKDCLPTCQTNVCGDGYRDMEGTGAAQTEACDDGNDADESNCPYGIQSCTLCAMGCDSVEDLDGNVCGDGNLDSMHETCDDHNTVEEATCPYGTYGTPACTELCSADCQTQLSLSGPYCGDGTPDPSFGEGCDDHNANACGTCDAGCNVSGSTKATGFIVAPAGSAISDDATLRIRDGFGRDVTFEFDDDMSGPSTAGNIVIDYVSSGGSTNTAGQMQTKIRSAINSGTANLGITATDGSGTFVLLANDRKSSLGNIPITASDSDIIVSGMSGGAGGDCLAGVGCNIDDDCRSNDCNTTSNTCRCASDADCATGTCMSGTCM